MKMPLVSKKIDPARAALAEAITVLKDAQTERSNLEAARSRTRAMVEEAEGKL